MDKSTLRLILEELVRHFADTEPDGTWFGYDTNLSDCEQAFKEAEEHIKNYYDK